MLKAFLDSKPLYYDKIDYTRMPRVYKTIQNRMKLSKIIHIIGTNGKGTTGRFLASALYSMGFNVGHYTSPHIVNFNERIWLNGANTSDALLNEKHQQLLKFLSEEDANSLSYFEYTTLLALLVYENVDYVVLEAGLGGEHDATAVFDNILSLVTPIAMDHEAFLGSTIREIAKTKLKAVRKHAILALQKNSEVLDVADEIFRSSSIPYASYKTYLESEDFEKIAIISKENSLEKYLEENLQVSIAALKYLQLPYSANDFTKSRLFGRLSPLSENIIVDVGHNTLAAQRIYESLKKFKYTLVYNSYKDKNYKEILSILAPIIEDIEIMNVEDKRIESQSIMKVALEDLGFEYKKFHKVQNHKNYLVFGSFSVVESFLKVYSE